MTATTCSLLAGAAETNANLRTDVVPRASSIAASPASRSTSGSASTGFVKSQPRRRGLVATPGRNAREGVEMALHWRSVLTTALIAGLGAFALLAINRPGVFTGSGSPGSIAATVIANYAGALAAVVFGARASRRSRQ